ncbi:MAG TPA: lysophospholipid acyltransferase family protein [Kribbellaceae bacterium]
MSDARIIPIGAGGSPGRGTGRRTTPSAAARSLAGPARAAAAKPQADKANPQADKAKPDRTGSGKAAAGHKPKPATKAEPKPAPVPVPPVSEEQDVTAPGDVVASELSSEAAHFAAFEQRFREVFGDAAERRLAELLAFLRRRLTGDYEVDEFGFDAELTDAVVLPLLRPLAERWFRVEVRGAENIPADGGALIVANHSGTLPLDGMVTMLVIRDHTGRPLRTLGADLVFKTPFVGELARKAGATLAGNDDAERLLGRGELVGVWPEGFKGIGKPFSERYKLQRFGRGGFVSAAMRTGVPIVPCSIVGAEEIYPLVGNIPSLARLLGAPYIPITPFFPLLGLLGLIPLPSKWLIEFGEPIRTDEFAPGAADDPMLVFNVTDQVRETIQQTLYSLLMQRRSVFF